MIAASGKMVLLDKLLPKLKREGHKVSWWVREGVGGREERGGVLVTCTYEL